AVEAAGLVAAAVLQIAQRAGIRLPGERHFAGDRVPARPESADFEAGGGIVETDAGARIGLAGDGIEGADRERRHIGCKAGHGLVEGDGPEILDAVLAVVRVTRGAFDLPLRRYLPCHLAVS